MNDIRAAVLRGQAQPFLIEAIRLAEPREDEVLVRIVASGICHTDQEVVLGHMPPAPPTVLGHEGAGVVERVGADVRNVRPGDHVILSYPSCGRCPSCEAGDPVRCPEIIPLAISGARRDGSPTLHDSSGEIVSGSFFGQSSFGSHALARWPGVVPIRKDAPLETLAPLGCGIQTGAGTIFNSLRPPPGSSIAIFGAGAVGLAAAMAAKIHGCTRIAVVDVKPSRLALATELGATDSIDASGLSPDELVKAVGEVDYSVEASGAPQAINASVAVLRMYGTCAMLGVASPGTKVEIDHGHLLGCRKVIGVMQGDANPQTFIPRLVELFMSGQLPIDRLIRTYGLDQINQAFADSASGETIKPVILM